MASLIEPHVSLPLFFFHTLFLITKPYPHCNFQLISSQFNDTPQANVFLLPFLVSSFNITVFYFTSFTTDRKSVV